MLRSKRYHIQSDRSPTLVKQDTEPSIVGNTEYESQLLNSNNVYTEVIRMHPRM